MYSGSLRIDSVLVPMLLSMRHIVDMQGSSLKHDGETSRGVDSTSSNVEVELADRDTHSADTEVTEPEDARAVRHDDDTRGGGEGLSVCRKQGGEAVL